MERRLQFLFILLIFSSSLWAQQGTILTLATDSEFEKVTLGQFGNEEPVIPFMLQLSVNFENSESPESLLASYRNYVGELAQKREKGLSDEEFLSHLYYRTHRKFLKKYTPYSSFSRLVSSGEYDCLSATALYALLLDSFDFAYEIIETDYHIYLIVNSGTERYMLESTDPINGFISGENEINDRVANITARNTTLSAEYLTLRDEAESFRDFAKLASLQYFNASVLALQENNVLDAVDQLEKARLYNESERYKEFGKYLAKMLVSDESLSPETRRQYLMKLTRFLNSGVTTASL